MNNQNGEASQNITINLYRCFSANRTGCYSTPQNVTIIRAQQPIRWTITPTTTITSPANINQPGQTLDWRHTIRNNGPNTTNRTVALRTQNQGHLGSNVLRSQNEANITNGSTRFTPSSHTITQNDVGNNLCRRTTATPRAWDNNGTVASANACRQIPYSYALFPTITNIVDGAVVDPGQAAQPVLGSVENRGPTKSHTGVRWQTTQVVYAPSVAPTNKAGGVSGSGPCAYFSSSESCDDISSGTRSDAFPGNGAGAGSTNTTTGNTEYTTGDLEAGSRVCFALSVQRNSSASTDWRHSPLSCLVVGKKPKVQVHGGSLSAGRTFEESSSSSSRVVTSTTDRWTAGSSSNFLYGSWAEYGIFAPGSIIGMASSSGLNSETVRTIDPVRSWSSLTYTNTGLAAACGGGYGCYRSSSSLPDPSVRFAITSTTPQLSTVDVATRTGIVTSGTGVTPTITIAGGEVGAGRSLIINAPDATVNITGNITYQDGAYNRVDQIPQVIIIARTINIQHSVTQVDAWLVAKGTGALQGVNTCATHGSSSLAANASLSAAMCNQQLTINGPVIANKLFLRRTHGSDVSSLQTPAEIINLRPDAYLWANEHMTSNNVLRTSSVRETTPRF